MINPTDCKLEVINIRKEYPGTVALKDFSSRFEGGKVHAIIGKNGSGKSTLVKIISGAEYPTKGKILLDGQPIDLQSPRDAFAKGIAMVYQELSLIPALSVTENILLGRLPRKNGIVIDWGKAKEKVLALLDYLKVNIPHDAPISSLSVGQQQVVEIAKAMSFNPSVLILDEPTSALAKHETQSLFNLIGTLKEQGVAILYITHRLQELARIADIVTVLRDGDHIDTIPIEEANPRKIVHMMFGKVEQKIRPADLEVRDEVVLEIRNFSRGHYFKNINFSLRKGEVLGIAGMLGSGRSELLRSIFGADPHDSGEIIYKGITVTAPNPMKMKNSGFAMTPENRKEEGLVQILTVRQNLCMAAMKRIAPNGLITRKKENVFADDKVNSMDIKISSTENIMLSLSGGNQQKVVIGNWLNNLPEIIFFDEPTRGIDVNAKQQIFQVMWDLSRDGLSSIFVSTELEELLEVCHRILIMKHGEIIRSVYPEKTGLDELYTLCMEEKVHGIVE